MELGLLKTVRLPFLLYGFTCVSASRSDIHLHERVQIKVVKTFSGTEDASNVNHFRLLNILGLTMFVQLGDILTMTKITAHEFDPRWPVCQRPGGNLLKSLFWPNYSLKKQEKSSRFVRAKF